MITAFDFRWTSCTVSCGIGTRMRTRECPSECKPGSYHAPQPTYSGSNNYKPAVNSGGGSGYSGGYPAGGGGDCPGDAKQTEQCGKPCAKWTPWTSWSPCSVSNFTIRSFPKFPSVHEFFRRIAVPGTKLVHACAVAAQNALGTH